jgi:hypothetical protein
MPEENEKNFSLYSGGSVMAKIAVLVGIDAYPASPLTGCVNDANRMEELLSRHADGSKNFDCKKLTAPDDKVSIPVLTQNVDDLFSRKVEVALFYYAGHGTVTNLGGVLVTQDGVPGNPGVSMANILTLANNSPADERVIILDCCYSGDLGQLLAISNSAAVMTEGVTILSASRKTEEAAEQGGGGLFTSLVCDALAGGAADVLGKVTTAGVYAYVDEALGGFEQRPLYKIHVASLMPLRYCNPAVELEILRCLPCYFPSPAQEFPLDPSYEFTSPSPDPEHVKIFRNLQKMSYARLIVPVGEEYMFFAALNSKSCRLTHLGVHYWELAKKGMI